MNIILSLSLQLFVLALLVQLLVPLLSLLLPLVLYYWYCYSLKHCFYRHMPLFSQAYLDTHIHTHTHTHTHFFCEECGKCCSRSNGV